jgi:hypothetical protein
MQLTPHRAVLVWAALVAAVLPPSAHGQRSGFLPDEQIVREARLAASGTRVDLYEHGVGADRALVAVAEKAIARMEELLGRKLDEAALGPKIGIYVSSGTRVSHVWRGYHHPSDPRPIVFLNPVVAGLAVAGTNATYAHELAHLLAWRFRSHTLREGLADYLALQLHPRAGIGPNPAGYGSPPPVLPEINDYLGTTRPAPDAVISDASFRRAYYYASYRFVRFLIGRAGMETFMKLYDAEDPVAEISRLYGASLQELVAAAASQ